MKNKRYYESLDVLISAYMKGNLKHGTACNCAIGNLIQSRGIDPMSIHNDWYIYLNKQKRHPHLSQLPYTLEEQLSIEEAFEGGKSNKCDGMIITTEQRKHRGYVDKDGFIGLAEVQEALYNMEDWSHEEVNLVELCRS